MMVMIVNHVESEVKALFFICDVTFLLFTLLNHWSEFLKFNVAPYSEYSNVFRNVTLELNIFIDFVDQVLLFVWSKTNSESFKTCPSQFARVHGDIITSCVVCSQQTLLRYEGL